MALLCVALDARQPKDVEQLAHECEPHVDVFKIGLTAYCAAGPPLVRALGARKPVFLDLKLHDIPAQVAGAVSVVRTLGARYVTVHAAGGERMVAAAAEAAGDRVTILAVTVLTSLSDEDLRSLGISASVDKQVVRLAELALGAGARGLVCSPLEVAALRRRFGPRDAGGPLLVVPGIRPSGAPGDDQRRTLTARDAIDLGADMLVVGRPITAVADPGQAAAALRRETAR